MRFRTARFVVVVVVVMVEGRMREAVRVSVLSMGSLRAMGCYMIVSLLARDFSVVDARQGRGVLLVLMDLFPDIA